MATEPVWMKTYMKARKGMQDNQQPANEMYKFNAASSPASSLGNAPVTTPNPLQGQYQSDAAAKSSLANSILGQYQTNINKPVTPFSYDMNSIKQDPLYTSGLASLNQDAQTATNQSLVNLGRRGIGNSQSAVTSANAQQQNVVNQANTKLAPQVIAQKYQQYLDANTQQQQQNKDLLGLAGVYDQQANNNINQGIARAGVTGYYNPSGMNMDQINQEIAKNSAAWGNASPEQQQQLHARNIELNALIGKTDTTGNGDYSGGNPNGNVGYRTVQGQQLDINKAIDQRNFDYTKGIDTRNFDYQTAQDAIKTGQWDKSFDMEMEKWADAKNLNWSQFDQSTKQALAQIAISQQNANTSSASQATSASNTAWAKDPNNPDNRYKEAQISVANAEKPPTATEANNQFTADVVTNVDKMPPDIRKTFFKNEKAALIAKLGKSGYDSIYNSYFDEYGEPK